MDSDTTGSVAFSGMRTVTRKSLFDMMKTENLRNLEEKLCYLKDKVVLTRDDLTNKQLIKLKNNFARFKSEMKKEETFLKNNQLWLEGTFEIPVTTQNRPGRPSKSFSESSERSKRRKTEEFRSNIEDRFILHAAQVELNKAGKRHASHVLKDIARSPTRATKYKTACLYDKLYPWHPMTPTLHKVLVHGSDIIKNALLSIGQLSEEAAEARNKHFRTYRQDYARKFSRESCNRDILNRLLLSSDPFLSASRVIKKKKMSSFLPETLNILLSATPNPVDASKREDEIN